MNRAACIVALALSQGCLIGGGARTVSAVELRASVAGVDLFKLDAKIRAAIDAGQIWPGQTETELFLSRGQPHLWWNTRLGQNACRVFIHHGEQPDVADLAVTTCGGAVIGTNAIQPSLPCWRLTDVGPRVATAASYFEERPLDVQWQIVIGILHRGQQEQDIKIAFGEPYSRGFDEREDGKRAEKLVFLDHSGDAYGLNVTLIDTKLVAWQMPAERVMTPEAQQRHLEAIEKRLTARIAEVEQLAIKQHAETVRLFNEAMASKDVMISQLTQAPSTTVVSRSSRDSSSPPAPPTRTVRSTEPSTIDRTPPTERHLPTPDGKCHCTGWPVGTDKKTAAKSHERCTPMKAKDADSCYPTCQASGFALGLFNDTNSSCN